jgi:hypothetical protein
VNKGRVGKGRVYKSQSVLARALEVSGRNTEQQILSPMMLDCSKKLTLNPDVVQTKPPGSNKERWELKVKKVELDGMSSNDRLPKSGKLTEMLRTSRAI